jgi:8-oxo-dGTP diphosphatase
VSVRRDYPDHPRVGVGAVIVDGERVLLVRRGRPPGLGKWSLPGGLVELGETTVEAIRREVEEETALRVRVGGVAGVVDRVIRDPDGRVRYHYVLVDYLVFPENGDARAGSDAAEVRWVPVDEVSRLAPDITDGLMDMIQRALALGQEAHG